jgi:hypothetical protein
MLPSVALIPAMPAPLPPWAKWLVRAVEWSGALQYLYDLLSTNHQGGVDDVDWRRVHLIWNRSSPSGAPEDQAMVTLDLLNITSGAIDTTWTNSDFTTCETALDTMVNTIGGYQNSNHTLVAYKWYRKRFNDLTNPKPYQPSLNPVRIQAKTIAGQVGTLPMPYQVACSVTEKTAFPRHWGRVYWPGIVSSTIQAAGGRWSTTFVDTIAGAFNTAYNTLATAGFYPVVPVTQVNKLPARGLLGVEKVQVDDVPDVIRSRRPRQVAYRKILP